MVGRRAVRRIQRVREEGARRIGTVEPQAQLQSQKVVLDAVLQIERPLLGIDLVKLHLRGHQVGAEVTGLVELQIVVQEEGTGLHVVVVGGLPLHVTPDHRGPQVLTAEELVGTRRRVLRQAGAATARYRSDESLIGEVRVLELVLEADTLKVVAGVPLVIEDATRELVEHLPHRVVPVGDVQGVRQPGRSNHDVFEVDREQPVVEPVPDDRRRVLWGVDRRG